MEGRPESPNPTQAPGGKTQAENHRGHGDADDTLAGESAVPMPPPAPSPRPSWKGVTVAGDTGQRSKWWGKGKSLWSGLKVQCSPERGVLGTPSWLRLTHLCPPLLSCTVPFSCRGSPNPPRAPALPSAALTSAGPSPTLSRLVPSISCTCSPVSRIRVHFAITIYHVRDLGLVS